MNQLTYEAHIAQFVVFAWGELYIAFDELTYPAQQLIADLIDDVPVFGLIQAQLVIHNGYAVGQLMRGRESINWFEHFWAFSEHTVSYQASSLKILHWIFTKSNSLEGL